MTGDFTPLLPGQLAILRAVAAGRVEITCSCEPDLYVDGLACCNQQTAHQLAHAGHVRPVRPGRRGQRVAAALTESGHHALTELNPDIKEAA